MDVGGLPRARESWVPILIESESRPDGKYFGSCFQSDTKFQNVIKRKKCLETKLLWTKTYIPLGIAQLGQMGGSQSSPRMFGALIQSIYCVTSFLSIPIQVTLEGAGTTNFKSSNIFNIVP